MSQHDEDEDALEVVASVGPLDVSVVLLRDYLHRTGAIRAVGVVERTANESPAVIDVGRLSPIEVDLGDRAVYLPHGAHLDAVAPELPMLRQLPAFEVDLARDQVAAPIGGMDHVVDGVRALAAALGGSNVAMVQFETTSPDTPLTLTARADGSEPIVVAIGDQQYEYDARPDAGPGA